MPHNINFREKKTKLRKDKKADGGAGEDASAVKSRVARFRYFEDISGYSGVRSRCLNACARIHGAPYGSIVTVHSSNYFQHGIIPILGMPL